MKFQIKQKTLMEHLNYVIRGISNKNLIPILNCIKFELTTDGLYLLSTDNELAVKSFIPKEEIDNIEVTGDILISGRYIYDIVKKLTNDIISIEEIIDSQVLITTETSSFKLNCNEVNEFPSIDLDFTSEPIFIDKKVFGVASSLPANYKVSASTTKVALRDAAKTVIPNESYKKKKLGFPVPLRKWMRDEDLYTEIKNTFSKDFVSEFFNKEYIIKLLEQHKTEKKDNYKKVWTIYCFLKWYEIFFIENKQYN